MKPNQAALLILTLFFTVSLDAVHYDASALYAVEASPQAYAKRYLAFKNWMRLPGDQREMLIAGYLLMLERDGPAQISAGDKRRAREILRNTSADRLVPYINKVYMFSKKDLRATGGGVEVIIHRYVQDRLETEKNHRELLEFAKILSRVKTAGGEESTGHTEDNAPDDASGQESIHAAPKRQFTYDAWQSRTREEKINLVTGYAAFLEILIKEDFCLDDEERRRFDLYFKLVKISELVDHVDSLYEDPLYREEGAQTLIYRYITYNFQNHIGDPLVYWG